MRRAIVVLPTPPFCEPTNTRVGLTTGLGPPRVRAVEVCLGVMAIARYQKERKIRISL